MGPKEHAEVFKADRKGGAGRGTGMCRGSEEGKNVCLLDGPTARSLVWLDSREQGWTGSRGAGHDPEGSGSPRMDLSKGR